MTEVFLWRYKSEPPHPIEGNDELINELLVNPPDIEVEHGELTIITIDI